MWDAFIFLGALFVEEVLKEYNFVRCHLSYLINVAYIESVGKDFIVLKNSLHISVS